MSLLKRVLRLCLGAPSTTLLRNLSWAVIVGYSTSGALMVAAIPIVDDDLIWKVGVLLVFVTLAVDIRVQQALGQARVNEIVETLWQRDVAGGPVRPRVVRVPQPRHRGDAGLSGRLEVAPASGEDPVT